MALTEESGWPTMGINIPERLKTGEIITLNGLPNHEIISKLACQIETNEQLTGLRFKILMGY